MFLKGNTYTEQFALKCSIIVALLKATLIRVPVCRFVHVSAETLSTEEGVRAPGGCEPPNVAAGGELGLSAGAASALKR